MKNLKVSSAMRETIESLEMNYGKLQKNYGTEKDECNIEDKEYYCFCELTDTMFKSFYRVVSFDGTIS